MAKDKFELPEIAKKYIREDEALLPDGFTIVRGELFKVRGKNSFGIGEWGITFKFDHLVTNTENGKIYVECFEMFRGKAGAMRAFPLERIKRIPKKRSKRVRRTTD